MKVQVLYGIRPHSVEKIQGETIHTYFLRQSDVPEVKINGIVAIQRLTNVNNPAYTSHSFNALPFRCKRELGKVNTDGHFEKLEVDGEVLKKVIEEGIRYWENPDFWAELTEKSPEPTARYIELSTQLFDSNKDLLERVALVTS